MERRAGSLGHYGQEGQTVTKIGDGERRGRFGRERMYATKQRKLITLIVRHLHVQTFRKPKCCRITTCPNMVLRRILGLGLEIRGFDRMVNLIEDITDTREPVYNKR
jgi:hypothetical protein